MAIQVDYPGVYIEEFAPGAPIQGVGTSTAAFLGPAANGPLNEAVKLTTWDAFLARYGSAPRDAQDYLWYAVRGFFQNNGKVCYILRVSNAAYARHPLLDGAGSPTLVARTRAAADFSANPVSIQVDRVNAQTTRLYRPSEALVSAAGAVAQVDTAAHAAQFRPGDRVTITQGGNNESLPVLRVEGNLLRLGGALTRAYNNTATVRLANLRQNVDDTFRVEAGDKIFPGSVITLSQSGATETMVVRSILAERISNSLTTYRISTTRALANNFSLAGSAANISVTSQEFTLTVSQGGTPVVYANLSMEPSSPHYYAAQVNGDPAGLIVLEGVEPPNITAHPDNRPVNLAATALTGGAADNPSGLTPVDYENALRRLEAIDDINLVLAPGQTGGAVQNALREHCEKMKDRFAILESHRGAPPFGSGNGSVEEQRGGLDSPNGYAALYYPWLQVTPADGKGQLLVPPGGHVAGIIARTDNNRGVFKAPAGLEAIVNGARGVDTVLSDTDQGQLNLKGINVIRVFQSGGLPVVWGARTTATNTNWQYVNIRRLFLFLEESIQEGIRWAVFEPNNTGLWAKLRRSIGAFLMQQWRDGALFGETPERAFYVRIDEALNPFTEQQLGRLYIEIGVRPSYPAEFIIVRIGIWDGGSEVSE